MQEQTPSDRHLRLLVKQVSEKLSLIRRIKRISQEHERLLERVREVPSNEDEMQKDWRDACAFVGLAVIDGTIPFTDVTPVSFPVLEEIWLSSVNKARAYILWEQGGMGGEENDYFTAAQEIRNRFFDDPAASLDSFKPVQDYIQENYLSETGLLDEAKSCVSMRLIAYKAQRLHNRTGEKNCDLNWHRAKLYVRMFYENIVPAVVKGDLPATLAILKAFQFSKSPHSRYLIINAFEAAIAVTFLDKAAIQTILDDPESYDFSLEPVEDWPTDFVVPADCDRRFRYDAAEKQLEFEGVMSDLQRDALLECVKSQDHKNAINAIYQQTHLQPYRDMIL